jgi:hypothetical protein
MVLDWLGRAQFVRDNFPGLAPMAPSLFFRIPSGIWYAIIAIGLIMVLFDLVIRERSPKFPRAIAFFVGIMGAIALVSVAFDEVSHWRRLDGQRMDQIASMLSIDCSPFRGCQPPTVTIWYEPNDSESEAYAQQWGQAFTRATWPATVKQYYEKHNGSGLHLKYNGHDAAANAIETLIGSCPRLCLQHFDAKEPSWVLWVSRNPCAQN